jgi:endosialidase-like protein
MRHLLVVLGLFIALLVPPMTAIAQTATDQSAAIPRLITITGVYRPADGTPPAAVETVTLSVYAEQQGGVPLFQETQQVTLDDRGRYSVVLGAAHADGIPPTIFATGAQWLGTVFERPGEVEGSRVRLTSVPYAMRAAEADTLGGRPASDYQLATTATGDADAKSATAATRSDVAGPTGTANFLPKYVDSVNFGDSVLYEAGGQIGLGTTTPFDIFHVRYTNTGGNLTGFAVQNMGNSATSYSGMLFYDQNNQLGQFQGFNNVTHEYRINNVARVTPGGAFNGSINFMLGGASKFIVAPNGNIGIGTTGPSALLEVSNAIPGGPANMWMTSYTNAINPYYMARRARGTPGAPTAVQTGDGLAGFYGEGYGTTAFGGGFAGGMTVQAAQNWADAAHGTQITFSTTPNGSTTSSPQMLIANSGMVGIGTTSPVSNLEVSNALSGTTFGVVTASTFGNNTGASLFIASKARGTSVAPTAILNGDSLGGFLARGFGTTTFTGTRGGMFVSASENWTDAAQGTRLNFNTTINGTTAPGTRMTIDGAGNVGIGTFAPNGVLEVVKTGTANVLASSFGGEGASFKARGANGSFAAPTATVLGDQLGAFSASGFNGTTGFNETSGMAAFAAENFTDTAQGTALAFFATPIASSEAQLYMAIMPSGSVGINPQFDANGFPIVNDKLQVYGDIRIGTTGTNGCIKNFAGTGILGTCSSDRRLKKNFTPFAPMLDKVTALQPVHYFWRADEFPDRHFGNAQNYGLIAQDVEQVLPELVSTDSDGYKAVDYSQLPLLTIQSVKELKAKNDALQQRVEELERLVAEMLAAKDRR